MRRGAAFAACPRRRRRGGSAAGSRRRRTGRRPSYAAASLTEVFPRVSPSSRFQFAGSNQLATQITRGAPADVFASASPLYTQDLYRNGAVERPRTFATNSLVLAVPRRNPARIKTVYDLAKRPKLRLVVAGQKVPIGLYTREVLKRLGLLRVLRKAVSQESDVKGIVGKLALGEADAGFVYSTDVRAASSRLVAIPLPRRSQPTVRYEVAVVKGARESSGRAGVRRRPPQHGRQARARKGGLRASVRSPFARRARSRDSRHPHVSPPADRRDLRRDPAGPAVGRPDRSRCRRCTDRDRQDGPGRERADPPLRDARRLPDRRALVSRQVAARHGGGAAARVAARGGGNRAARRVRPLRSARRDARASSGSRSRSRRWRSCSRSASSRARSTSAPRSRRSRRSTRR